MMIMKKIFHITLMAVMAFGLFSCQEEPAVEPEPAIVIYLADQPEADLSELQADVKGCTYDVCVYADAGYEVELSGVFADSWIVVGEGQYDSEKSCDVIPVVVSAADEPAEERTATIRFSAKDGSWSYVMTVRQGVDLFRRGVSLDIDDKKTRYFAPGSVFELTADNPNASEFLQANGITVDCSFALPEDPKAEVRHYNENHYADCELLPSDMYSFSSAVSEDGRKVILQLNIDRHMVMAEEMLRPYVLPLKAVVGQGLYESEVFYVTVPTYCSSTEEFTELEPQHVVNLNGYTVNPDGVRRLNQLLVFNAAPGNDKAVLFCPGGGYGALHASKANIDFLLGTNTTVAVLLYRMPCQQWQGRHEFPVEDAVQGLMLLRENAQEWGGYTKYGVAGRSAGGHLAGVTAAYNKDLVDFQILLYPVITMQPGKTHAPSTERFLGLEPSQELIDKWSVHKLVDDYTPRAFVAYATNDGTVPPQHNGAEMKAALQKVSYPSLHQVNVYSYGGHSSTSWEDFPECVHQWMNRF